VIVGPNGGMESASVMMNESNMLEGQQNWRENEGEDEWMGCPLEIGKKICEEINIINWP
jgi:hypothetical protein